MILEHPLHACLRRIVAKYNGKFHEDFLREFTIEVAKLQPDEDLAVAFVEPIAAKLPRPRPPQPTEVRDLIRGAHQIISGEKKSRPRPGKDASPDRSMRSRFAGKPGALEQLRLTSDLRHFTAGQVLLHLFHQDERICLTRTKEGAEFATTEEWAGRPDLPGYQFILPSPVRPQSVARSAGDVPARRYFVHECDEREDGPDAQVGYIRTLENFCRLKMVVFSAGKSLHAWFDAEPRMENEFYATSISLGGDPSMAYATQICRLPLGNRPPSPSGGGLQTLEYLRPLDA